MTSVDRATVARSTAWVAASSFVLGMLDVVTTLLCIRLWVTTADFGAATLAIALFPILDRIGGMSLGAALVWRPGEDEPEVAASTVFWMGLAVAATVLAWFVAARPLVAAAFGAPIVASLLAAYGVRLVIQPFAIVPEARMRRAMRFHELSIIRVIAGGAETATKLGLAYLGAHGHPELRVWCFAVGPIVNTAVATIALQIRCPWWPRRVFDRITARAAARFVGAMSGGELLYFAYTSADYLVVGAYFGHAALGAYRLAYELVLDVVRLVSMVTAEVAFPVFAQLRRDEVGAQLLAFTRQNLVLLAPFLAFIAIDARDVLELLYGALPAAAARSAQILCVVGALRALAFIVPSMLAGIGEPRRILIYNAIAAIALPTAFVIAGALGGSFTAVAWAWAIGYPVAFGVLLWLALPRVGVRLTSYVRAIVGIAACAGGAAVIGHAVHRWFDQPGLIAGAVLASYAALLAVVLGITPGSVARSLRASGSTTTTRARETTPPPGT